MLRFATNRVTCIAAVAAAQQTRMVRSSSKSGHSKPLRTLGRNEKDHAASFRQKGTISRKYYNVMEATLRLGELQIEFMKTETRLKEMEDKKKHVLEARLNEAKDKLEAKLFGEWSTPYALKVLNLDAAACQPLSAAVCQPLSYAWCQALH